MTDDSGLHSDLDAFTESTGEGLPSLPHVIARVRFDDRKQPTWKEKVMTTTASATRRPWMMTAAVTVAMAIVLLAVPISYHRTTGHEVKLTLSGATLDAARVSGIANELKTALDAPSVLASMANDGGGDALTLTATVAGGAAVEAEVVARAFAQSLEAKGYRATAAVRPIRDKVSDSMVAYARDNLIRIPVDGKSAAEIEAEIRNQLAAAGIPDAQVSVTDEIVNGQPARKVKVNVDRTRTAQPGDAGEFDTKLESEPEIVLTKDGQVLPAGGPGVSLRVFKKRTASGVSTIIETQHHGRDYRVEIPNSDTLSESALAQAIEGELAKAGFRARVTMSGGHLELEPLP